MRTGWCMAVVLAAVVAIMPATQMLAQQTTVQMRPDEAMWNAIRDGSSTETLGLFLKLYPQSPYAPDATAKLKALGAAAAAATPAPAVPVVTAAPADPAASLDARIEAISFLGVLGLNLSEGSGRMTVTAVTPGSEFATIIQPGDQLVWVGGKGVSTRAALADQLTYLGFGMSPIAFEFDRQGTPILATGSLTLTTRLATALKGLAEGERGVELNVWRANDGHFSPEVAASFAMLNPGHAFAAKARKYALAFDALRPLVPDRDAMVTFENSMKAKGYLQAYWVMGAHVVDAIGNYQKSRGLEQTGILNQAQLRDLSSILGLKLSTALDAAPPATQATHAAPAAQQTLLAPSDPLADANASLTSKLVAASFMRFYGFFVEERTDGLFVTGIPPRSPYGSQLQVGDKLVASNDVAVATIAAFTKNAGANAKGSSENRFKFSRGSNEFTITIPPTDSQWNFDVRHALLFFEKGDKAVRGELWAPTYDRTFFQIAANFALAYPDDKLAKAAAEYALAFAALNDLGFTADSKKEFAEHLRDLGHLDAETVNIIEYAPDSSEKIIAAIKSYQSSIGATPDGILTAGQLEKLTISATSHMDAGTVFSEVAGVLKAQGIDTLLVQSVVDRAVVVYQQVLGKWDTPDPRLVMEALQAHYGLPKGPPDIELILKIVNESVRLADGQLDTLKPAFVSIDSADADVTKVIASVGLDAKLVPEVHKRALAVYQQKLGLKDTPNTAALYEALRTRYGLAATAPLDLVFLRELLSEQVTIVDTGDDHYERFGDWRFRQTDKHCVMATGARDMATVTGAFIDEGAPRISIARDPRDSGSSLMIFYGNENLFAPDAGVSLVAGKRRVPMKFNSTPGAYGEKPVKDGTISGESVRIFKRASATVEMTGKSRFGGNLSIGFSSAGFSKAFDALNERCGKGKLGAWVR